MQAANLATGFWRVPFASPVCPPAISAATGNTMKLQMFALEGQTGRPSTGVPV